MSLGEILHFGISNSADDTGGEDGVTTDTIWIAPGFHAMTRLTEQGHPALGCSRYTSEVLMSLACYLGRQGRRGWGIFHHILSLWTQINKPAGKHLPSDPAWGPWQLSPRCRWCKMSGTQGHAADHPTACLLSRSRGGCFPSLSGSHCSSGSPR